jgi:hypothetical protein
METRTALLYGQSMLLSLVANSLEQDPHLHVIHASAREQVEALVVESNPQVLIFDLNEACQKLALPLLVRYPQMLLIGLDAESNHAVLLSGQETHAFTMEQIRELVEGRELEQSQSNIDNSADQPSSRTETTGISEDCMEECKEE